MINISTEEKKQKRLLEKIKGLEKKLDKSIGYYFAQNKNILPKSEKEAMLMAEKIKLKTDQKIILELNEFKRQFDVIESKIKKLNMLFNGLFKALLNYNLNIEKHIEKTQNKQLLNLFDDFNKNDIYKCKKYSFNFNNTEEYFFEKDGKFLLTEKGKEFNSLMRSKVDMKKMYKIINRMGIFGEKIKDNIEIVYYIISKHNKFVEYYSFIYDNSDFFIKKIENDIESKIEEYIKNDFLHDNNKGSGAIKVGENNSRNFITSFTIDIQLNNDSLKNIEIYKILNKFLNIKKLYSTKKEFIQVFKNKQINCSFIIDKHEENTQCYLMFSIDNEVQKIVRLSIQNKNMLLENLINNKIIELNKYEINISFLANESFEEELFYEKIKRKLQNEEIEEDKFSIMIVGGIWSEASQKEISKEYNATFVSLEEYERYSEKSKNMDYIFIDTSANTHSNTYKAKSIHDNVKLISRSKKEEIDKWIK